MWAKIEIDDDLALFLESFVTTYHAFRHYYGIKSYQNAHFCFHAPVFSKVYWLLINYSYWAEILYKKADAKKHNSNASQEKITTHCIVESTQS